MTMTNRHAAVAAYRPAALDETAAFTAALSDLPERVAEVARIAAADAVAVDRDGRFPAAAIEAAKRNRLLGVLVPREFGGEAADIHDVMEMCFALGRACASTAMIVAMHHVKVACLVRHGRGNPTLEALMQRIAAEQMLMASSTTEGNNGGNVRASAGPVVMDGDAFTLDRAATVISYGREADGLVTTARRSPDAAASDQVLVAVAREDYTLEPGQGWDTLGMRGTCSTGFELKVRASAGHVFEEPYERIHVQTMTPYAHLCWGSAWAGIAAAAVDKAHLFVRKVARASGGQMPPGAAHFTRAKSQLGTIRSMLTATADLYALHSDDERTLGSLDFQSQINLLKVEVSELAVATTMSAMRACGLSGYRNDGDVSVGRHLRDLLSAPLMISNDRILANTATASLLGGVPARLRG